MYLFRNILILITIISIFSCSPTEVDVVNYHDIKIEISNDQQAYYTKFDVKNSHITAFNNHNFALDHFKIDQHTGKGKTLEPISSFEKQGPKSLSIPSIFASYKGVYFMWDMYKQLSIFNKEKSMLQQLNFSFTKDETELGFSNGFSVNPPKDYSIFRNELIVPLYKLVPRSAENYYDSLNFIVFNLLDYSYQLEACPLPADFRENYWPTHDRASVIKLSSDTYIISFESMSDIFKWNKSTQNLERIELELMVDELVNRVPSFTQNASQIEAYRNRKYSYGNQRFFPLKYDEMEHTFYRIIKGPTNGSSLHATENLYLFKWDKDFRLLKYAKLKDGLRADFRIDQSKLYFQWSTQLMEDEDHFYLTIIEGF